MLGKIGPSSNLVQQTRTNSTSLINSIGEKEKINNNRTSSDDTFTLNTNDREKLAKVVDGLNEIMTPSNTSLKFEYHDKLNEYYVTLVDEKTKEVVKEIPSKKMLDFYAAMTEAIGIMIDKKI